MPKPSIPNSPTFQPSYVQTYERYLPTAFDESMSILQKLNQIIMELNRIGRLSYDLLDRWNNLMDWVLNEGLQTEIIRVLKEWLEDGTLDTIINQEILGSKATIHVTKTEPTKKLDNTTFWFQEL